MKPIKLAKILTFAGVIPFITPALSSKFNVNGFYLPQITFIYAALIISFLSGIHWAANIFYPDKAPKSTLLMSNVIVLVAWLSLLIKSFLLLLIIHLVCFIYLLFVDKCFYQLDILPKWFYDLRKNVTVVVVLILLVRAVFL